MKALHVIDAVLQIIKLVVEILPMIPIPALL